MTYEEQARELLEYCVPYVAEVMRFGGEKHGAGTWKEEKNPSLQVKSNFSSMARHNAQNFAGEYLDKETGKPHLASIITRASMELYRNEELGHGRTKQKSLPSRSDY